MLLLRVIATLVLIRFIFCVTPPHSPAHSPPHQPSAADFDWDFLEPLSDVDIGHSLIESPVRSHTEQISRSHEIVKSQDNPRNVPPFQSVQVDIRKIPKSSGKVKMTVEEKRERHKLKQRAYRQRIKNNPVEHKVQKEKTKARYKKWWSNLPKERLDEIRERNMYSGRDYRMRVLGSTPRKERKQEPQQQQKQQQGHKNKNSGVNK